MTEKITTKELVKRICRETGMVCIDVKLVLKAMTDLITELLQAGRQIELWGFGTFETREYGPMVGKDLNGGTSVYGIPARKVPWFRFGRKYKESIR